MRGSWGQRLSHTDQNREEQSQRENWTKIIFAKKILTPTLSCTTSGLVQRL